MREYDAKDAETMQGKTREQAAALVNNAIFKLEHVGDDKRRAQSEHERLSAITVLQDARYADDAASNARLRQAARRMRHDSAVLQAEAMKLRFSGPLLPPSEEDSQTAAAAIMDRDLRRLETGHLRSSVKGSGSALVQSQRLQPRRLGHSQDLILLQGATASLCSSGAGAAVFRMPVVSMGTCSGDDSKNASFSGAASAAMSDRLAALNASLTHGPLLSLLPPGRAAQILTRPLTVACTPSHKPPPRGERGPEPPGRAGEKRKR